MEKTGFIYLWYDRKNRRYYLGSHLGTEDDGYVCSSKWMRQSYKRRPSDFKRRILQRNLPKQILKEEEYKWLKLIKKEELGQRYYNLTIALNGNGWEKGKTRSEETKKKISNTLKESWINGNIKPNKGNFNKDRTPWNKGKVGIYSDETKKKISESVSKSLKGKPSRSKGYKHTDEWKKSNSERLKQQWANGTRKGGWIAWNKGLKMVEE